MAKASWLSVVPDSGSGNGNVAVSSVSEHTGRVARQTTLTWTAANCADVPRTVIQAGKPEYTSFDESTVTVDKTGGTVTITGYSNSSQLTFTLGSGDLSITLPATYIANSITTDNGAAIAGDPGADAEYVFSIQFTLEENETVDTHSMQVIVTDAAGNSSMCTLTEAAGDPYLRLPDYPNDDDVITLDYMGTEVDVTVESNTTWTVE